MSRLFEGRVVDAAHQPVAGANVMIAHGTVPTPEIALRTGPDGRFRINLPQGTFRIEAHGADDAMGAVEVVAGEERFDLEIQLGTRAER